MITKTFSIYVNWMSQPRPWLALILGVLSTLAFPSFSFWPILALTLPPLLWMLNKTTTNKHTLWLGWLFGFGHFTSGFYWISNALLVEGFDHIWLWPLAAIALPAVLAFYPAIACWLVYKSSYRGWRQVLWFALAWTILEIARGYLFTGFPWNLMGYVWSGSDAMLQSTAYIGAYGLSFITVVTLAMPASQQRKPVLYSFAFLALLWVGGTYRLDTHPTEFQEGFTLKLVQPSIPQAKKWQTALKDQVIDKLVGLSETQPSAEPTFIIWPETAIPAFLQKHPEIMEKILPIIPQNGALLTGIPRFSIDENDNIDVWNSLVALNSQGKNLAIYDKAHLVPFGEYVPFREYLPIERVVPGMKDFSPGPGPQTLQIPNLPGFSPLICYEVIFPGYVADKNHRPDWLLNITNDSWYGRSSGPYQHFEIARVRAIEEGLPLIRAANNGISGIIDSYGRVIESLSLDEIGSIDTQLPQPIINSTIYSRYGLKILLLVFMFTLVGLRLKYKAQPEIEKIS